MTLHRFALPHRLDVITKRIAANDVGLRLDTPQLGTLLEGMQKIANPILPDWCSRGCWSRAD